MEDLVFTLSGVLRSKGQVQDFVGPLSLILQLLSKNKIEIKDVSISLICEQYIRHLGEMKAMDLEVASEFIAMASYLLYLKAKALLAGEQETEEVAELMRSLEDLQLKTSYSRVCSVTGTLAEMYRSGCGCFVKPPESLGPPPPYSRLHDPKELLSAMRQMMGREELERLSSAPGVMIPRPITYSVEEKASEILERVRLSGAERFSELFCGVRDRAEMVAVFIAVLELCRVGKLVIVGIEDDLTVLPSEDASTAGGFSALADEAEA